MDLAGIVALLRRRWLSLLLCVLVGAGVAAASAERAAPVYESSARLFINVPTARSAQEAVQGVQLSSGLIKSYAEIVTSRSVAERVRERAGLSEPVDAIARALHATPGAQTVNLTISARDGDPVRATLIANTAALVLNETIADLERDRDRNAAVEARIIDEAGASVKVAPRPARSIGLGLLLGLLAGLSLAFVIDALDRTVKTSSELERLLITPSLGMVPRIREAGRLPVANDSLSAAAEAYRTIRTGLRFVGPDDAMRSLVVTSSVSGEGKTTTAANLALALAQSGERVVVVDADLRRASLAPLLGIEGAVGLSDVIIGRVSLADALQPWQDTLLVLPAGTLPPNPSELLGSQRMTAVLEELQGMCDIVVLDTPPVLPVTDAVVLAAQADAVVLVARHGKTGRTLVADAGKRLHSVGAQLAGTVLNAVPGRHIRSYYEAYERAVRTLERNPR